MSILPLIGRVIPLGRMEINPISSLTKLTYSKSSVTNDVPSLNDIDSDNDETDQEGEFNSPSKNLSNFLQNCLFMRHIKDYFHILQKY